jgi:RNA polymerase sigma-70 factor (ECF subfamily)
MIRCNRDAVYKYVCSRLAPQIDRADDVVQDVFLAALQNLNAYRGQAVLESWLIGIADHKVKDFYRRRQRAPEPFETFDQNPEAVSFTPDFEGKIDSAFARKKVRGVLTKLPKTYRRILILRYWQECSVRTIARRIGKSEKAIERTLARARDQFRSLWNQEP